MKILSCAPRVIQKLGNLHWMDIAGSIPGPQAPYVLKQDTQPQLASYCHVSTLHDSWCHHSMNIVLWIKSVEGVLRGDGSERLRWMAEGLSFLVDVWSNANPPRWRWKGSIVNRRLMVGTPIYSDQVRSETLIHSSTGSVCVFPQHINVTWGWSLEITLPCSFLVSLFKPNWHHSSHITWGSFQTLNSCDLLFFHLCSWIPRRQQTRFLWREQFASNNKFVRS